MMMEVLLRELITLFVVSLIIILLKETEPAGQSWLAPITIYFAIKNNNNHEPYYYLKLHELDFPD